MYFLARCFAKWCIRRQGRLANGSCSGVCCSSCEKRRPSSFIPLQTIGMNPQRAGMGRDGGLWLGQLVEIGTGLLRRILRARPEYLQAQGRASKPY